jgi:hypothetical protein
MPCTLAIIESIFQKEQLAFLGPDMQWIVEPGDFVVMVIPSSEDTLLTERFIVE